MYIVILAGGSGTRFWPLSRTARPKQLISVTGKLSMLQQTVERVLPMKPKRIMIVTNALQSQETELQLAHYRKIPIDIISEPVARNTAPAIALATGLIAAHDPAGVMVVLPADHFIRDEAALRESLLQAVHAAKNGFLVTLGIVPTRPETGYGYIEADMELRGTGPFPVKSFVEKPPLETALHYIQEGNFFWNSGMFAWRADVIKSEMDQYCPGIQKAMGKIEYSGDVWELSDLDTQIEAVYSDCESISIDYAVMEKSQRVQVVPVEMGWSDVGSWTALPEVVEADTEGTVYINADQHISINSANCIIYGDDRLVATIGVSGLVIVSTKDALLVCNRERCQDVKKVVEQLHERGLVTHV